MSDFNYTPSADLSLNGLAGGGRTYDLISPDVVEAAIASDRTGFCRMQPLAGQHKAAFTTYGDLRHDRPHLFLDDQLHLLTEFTYTMPSHIPGTDGATTSSGTAQTDRGGLICAFRGAGFRAGVYVERITLGGAYGQTSTIAASSVGVITTSSATEVAVYAKTTGAYDVVLFPSGTAAGDTVRVRILVGRFASGTDGYIRSWAIGEPYMPAAL